MEPSPTPVTVADITFRPLAAGDLPLLAEWLARPHVAEWWGAAPSLAEVEADYGPAIRGEEPLACYLALEGGEPVGFVQAYRAVDGHSEGWWLGEHDPGVWGMDLLVGDVRLTGRGLGTRVVRAFVARLLADPAVTRVQIDPSPANARAVRCYARAGFRAAGAVDTPDGRALLMYAERR